MSGVVSAYRVGSWQGNPLWVASRVSNSSVIGSGLGFEGINSFASGLFPEIDARQIQAFEVKLSEGLWQTPISQILTKPEVIDYVRHRIDVITTKARFRGTQRDQVNQLLMAVEHDLFLTTESNYAPVRLELVLPGRGRTSSLIISHYSDLPRGSAVRAVKLLEIKAVQAGVRPAQDLVAQPQDAVRRRQLGLEDRGHDTQYEEQLRPFVVPGPSPARSAGRIGTALRRAGYRTEMERADDRTERISTAVRRRSGAPTTEPRNMTEREFYEYIKLRLKRNGFEAYGNRPSWIDFKNQRKKNLNEVVRDPKKLYKLFIKPSGEHFFTVLERVLTALRGEENVYGKFWRNPQEGRNGYRGNDPYGNSQEPTFLLYFYGFDADYEMVRIAELLERQFTRDELIEFGADENTRLDWEETEPDDPEGQLIDGYGENGRPIRVKVKKVSVPQRGPSFTAEVIPDSFLFWGQGGFSESEREGIASLYSRQSKLRREKLAELFNGDNFCKYRSIPEPFTVMYEDRKLLQRVRQREVLLFSHSTAAVNAETIAMSGVLRQGRNGALGFRYGMNFSYGPNGMVTFVMKRDFHTEDILFDGFGLRRSGEGNDEFRRRMARNQVFLSDISTQHYLKDDGVENGWRGDRGRTVMMDIEDRSDPEGPVFAVHLPQLDIYQEVPLSEVYAVLVPEHVYEQVRKAFLRHNKALADKIRIVRDTGSTEEEYMEGIENMPKRSSAQAGQHKPVVGFKAAHRIFVEYLRVILEATET